jgi:hypothetical protein
VGLIVAVVVVIVVLLIAAVVAYEIFAPKPSPIQVGAINIWAPDNVCGLNSNPIYYNGYNSSTNASLAFDLGVPNYNSTTCNVTSVVTNSSGFSLSSVEVPLTIPGGETGFLNLTITSPRSSFSGNLNLVFA